MAAKVESIPWEKRPLWDRLHKIHCVLLISTPLIAIYGFMNTPMPTKTLLWTLFYYYISAFGITGGYHRLWAHKSYSAVLPIQILLSFAGAAAVQGSIHWWSRGHRAHHRYVDTDKDPYDAKKGLWHSHLGWLLMKPEPGKIGYADTSDLKKDPVVAFQHKFYPYFAIFMGFVFPTLVPGLGWGDWRGGFYYSAITRLVFVHHATFCVNSLAHYIGEFTYDDKHTPRDHIITAFVTLGEGYHNFHHEFPGDYRNAIRFYQYDPTKWSIRFMSFFGLTYGLKRFPTNEIVKGYVHMQEKKIDGIKKTLDWGKAIDTLPAYTQKQFQHQVATQNCKWVIVDGIIHDVEDFIHDHPGGKALIKSFIGKDCTGAFTGGVYDHSNGARNLLTSMRVGVIQK